MLVSFLLFIFPSQRLVPKNEEEKTIHKNDENQQGKRRNVKRDEDDESHNEDDDDTDKSDDEMGNDHDDDNDTSDDVSTLLNNATETTIEEGVSNIVMRGHLEDTNMTEEEEKEKRSYDEANNEDGEIVKTNKMSDAQSKGKNIKNMVKV